MSSFFITFSLCLSLDKFLGEALAARKVSNVSLLKFVVVGLLIWVVIYASVEVLRLILWRLWLNRLNSLLHWLIFEIRDFIYLLMASIMEWWFQVIPIVLLIITFSVLGEWAEFGKIHKKAFYSLAQGFCSILFYFLHLFTEYHLCLTKYLFSPSHKLY